MNRKLTAAILLSILPVLSGCGSSNTPESAVKSYLSLIQKNNDAYVDYVCIRRKSEPHVERFLKGMSNFEIQDISDNPEKDYPSFIVQVLGVKNDEEFVFNLVTHETEPLYQDVRALSAKINSLRVQREETSRRVSEILGETPSENDETNDVRASTPPERSSYSPKKFCVTGKVLI